MLDLSMQPPQLLLEALYKDRRRGLTSFLFPSAGR